jgi:hypothetical protein
MSHTYINIMVHSPPKYTKFLYHTKGCYFLNNYCSIIFVTSIFLLWRNRLSRECCKVSIKNITLQKVHHLHGVDYYNVHIVIRLLLRYVLFYYLVHMWELHYYSDLKYKKIKIIIQGNYKIRPSSYNYCTILINTIWFISFRPIKVQLSFISNFRSTLQKGGTI